MKNIGSSLVIVAIAVGFASCAQPEKPEVVAKAAPLGSHFDDVGKVKLHDGEPCTSQIMFDFRGANLGRTVWLAARMRETKILTDASKRGRRVHVWGAWQRGRDKACSYVHVTKVSTEG
jgi:hypothetical protein